MKNFHSLLLALTLLFLMTESHLQHLDRKQIQQKISQTKISYGDTVRIRAGSFAFHLHSHKITYPRGSGYQSVTGFSGDNDYNSLWVIKQAHQLPPRNYHNQVKCEDVVRLEHSLTHRNLHSEQLYQSMITQAQEVSAYGNSGRGTTDDNWILKCKAKAKGEVLHGYDLFELHHQKTNQILKMSRYYEYSYNNWENIPFQGQLEVSASNKATKENQFKIVGGIFFKNKQVGQKQEDQANPTDSDL